MNNVEISAMLAYYVRSIEGAADLQCLDQYFCRAGDYISSTQEAEALPAAQIQALVALFDHLYQQSFIRPQAHCDGLDQIER